MSTKASAWHDTELDVFDHRRWSDTGVNVQWGRINFTAHVGPNKLRRYPGYQMGIEVNGSRKIQYGLLTIWVIYWTLNIGVTWHGPHPKGQ